jgi:hypothetical protein
VETFADGVNPTLDQSGIFYGSSASQLNAFY